MSCSIHPFLDPICKNCRDNHTAKCRKIMNKIMENDEKIMIDYKGIKFPIIHGEYISKSPLGDMKLIPSKLKIMFTDGSEFKGELFELEFLDIDEENKS